MNPLLPDSGTNGADAALVYAAVRRWSILPLHSPRATGCSCGNDDCASVGKHPRTAHGLKDATVDRDVIADWWGRWPDANVGVATGAASGLFVVDVDGEAGVNTLLDLQRLHGALPPTPWVRTGSGWHAYFRHPGGTVGNSAGRLGPGVDTRGDGGFVVAPPSLHVAGNRYRWYEAGDEEAFAPAWLFAKPRVHRAPIQMRPPKGCDRYSLAALEYECEAVAAAPEGGRNHRLNEAAFSLGTLVGAGLLDPSSVIDALRSAAASAGLGASESEATIASGLRAGMAAPRQVRQ